jgi:predicted transcriptional regulator
MSLSTEAPQTSTEPRRQESVTVADVMHHGVLSCPADAPLVDVARTMAEHRVHGVVVDGMRRGSRRTDHAAWGVVSDLDLVGRLGAPDALDATAADLAVTPAVVVGADDPLAEAARLMHDYDVHRLLVVDVPQRRPVGVVSTLDVVQAIAAGRV